MENSSRTLHVDRNAVGPVISPFLFGHNLEHTRRAMWKGLSAQLLANRKFTGAVNVRTPDNKTELVKNAVGSNGVAAGWRGIGAPNATFAHETRIGYAGNESQKISIAAGSSGGLAQSGIALQAGAPYTLRLCLKSETAIRGGFRFTNAAGTATYASTQFTLEGKDWLEWKHTFVPSATDEQSTLEISFAGPTTVWLGVASLLPDSNFLGLRRDVVELLQEMSVPMLRWPGGNFTLDYRWQDGLLSVDRRPTIRAGMSEVLPFTNSCDFHEIGIDDFIALCRHLGAEPFLTVNLRPQDIGTPEDAAGWVEYCNGSPETKWGSVRAQRGHPEPYRVKYWSIGNEIWGDHMLQTHCDAHEYARRVRVYAPAMRKADPSIVLTAVGIPALVWDAIVVSESGEHFDLLSGHEYVKPEGHDAPSYTRLADAASIHFLEKLRACRKIVDEKSPAGKKIGLAFDEYNIWHNWFAGPFDNEWNVGPVDGGFFGALLNMFCREFENVGLTLASLFQPVNEGAIAVGPFTSFLTPVGQVFKLFRAHHGQRQLKLSNNPSELDAAASISADGKRIQVTLTSHAHGTGPGDRVTIKLPGCGARTATITYLSAPDTTPNRAFTERRETQVIAGESVTLQLAPYTVALLSLETGK